MPAVPAAFDYCPRCGPGMDCRVRTHDPYPEPTEGTKEEAIKAALKNHRNLERIRLNSRATTATGVELRTWMAWLLDVWRLAGLLPPVQAEVVRLYYLSEGDDGLQRTDVQIGQELGMSERQVRVVKRAALARITEMIWPPMQSDGATE